MKYAAEITFVVSDTFRGEARDFWTVVWQNSTFEHPDDLNAFKEEIGDDLVIVLREPGDAFDPQTSLPMIVYDYCSEPAMQVFEVMEPTMRERRLID